MGKRIEGSYTSIEETMQTVRRLLNESVYLSGDIIIVTNRKNRENLEELTSVQVAKVATVEDKSAWDRFKGMFTAANDEATLEHYGIEMHEAVKFEYDLKNGNYIVIVEEDNISDPTQNHVTSMEDAIVEAREGHDDFQDHSSAGLDLANEEDPLLNGSVDRGPIYGVVNDETNKETLDDISDDEDSNV